MGLIGQIMSAIFGDGRNVVAETVQVFRENAENRAVRDADAKAAALAQLAAEFGHARQGWFDRFIDGLNRLPRPMLALGTIGLFVAAMTDPVWFAQRMVGVTAVPEPLWWLMGAIVSFYFGARHQLKGQEFQREIAQTAIVAATDVPARPDVDAVDNAALADWQAGLG
ncbi:MAG: holin family protein [Yoonia sp.]|nr:holin family protein [Yoonia sp.]